MATWSEVQNVGNGDASVVETDGVSKIYLKKQVSGSSEVHVYDVIADTLTQLSAFGVDVIAGPVYFQGGLYCATEDDIYKYSGTGTTWNSVHSLPGFPYDHGSLGKTSSQLVMVVQDVNSHDLDVFYSSDGSSWSSGTEDSTPALPASLVAAGDFRFRNPTNGTLDTLYALHFDGSIALTNTFRYRVMSWNGSGLVTEFYYTRQTIGGAITGDNWVQVYYLADHLHWHSLTGDNEQAEILGTFSTPANPSVRAVPGIGFATITCGYDFVSSNTLFYQMPAGSLPRVWDSGEVVGASATVGDIQAVVRFPDDSVYLVSDNGSTVRIYARSEGISDSLETPNAAFYYGRGGLQNRVALPFSHLNIGGLAVPYPYAVLGAGVSGSPMVVYAQPGDSYASFTDFSGALEDDPIMAFDSTPWGDATGAAESGEDSGPGGGLSNGKC